MWWLPIVQVPSKWRDKGPDEDPDVVIMLPVLYLTMAVDDTNIRCNPREMFEDTFSSNFLGEKKSPDTLMFHSGLPHKLDVDHADNHTPNR